MAAETFEAILDESLDLIDRELGRRGILPAHRPLQAATDFVRFRILAVREGVSGEGEPPGEAIDYARSRWFRAIFRATHDWYIARYGAMITNLPDHHITGVVLVFDTPFLIKVPLSSPEPDVPGETIWLCFHNKILPEDDTTQWICDGPDLSRASRKDLSKARRICDEVAGRLRSISNNLMEMEGEDLQVRELRDGIIPNLERAAEQIAKARTDDLKRAHWDIQMACEGALKALSQQRSGSFKRTHDLFDLYDRMPGGPPAFPRYVLSRLPNWEMMAELRYGRGAHVSLKSTFAAYRSSLQIVEGTTSSFTRKFILDGFRIKLGKPPWLEDP